VGLVPRLRERPVVPLDDQQELNAVAIIPKAPPSVRGFRSLTATEQALRFLGLSQLGEHLAEHAHGLKSWRGLRRERTALQAAAEIRIVVQGIID
jgi:hypothetical protein